MLHRIFGNVNYDRQDFSYLKIEYLLSYDGEGERAEIKIKQESQFFTPEW
jgi:hypothetical protein